MKNLLSKIIDAFQSGIKGLSSIWRALGTLKKILVISIGVVLVSVVIAAFFIGSKPQMVAVFTKPISDEQKLEAISVRLDEESIPYTLTSDGRIMVSGLSRARQVRSILVREKLLPNNTDPWDLFDVSRWTQTDFDRNVNLRRSITRQLIQHIEALDDIDNAEVTLVMPEETLFSNDQDPVSASVILTIKPGSDFRDNRKKVEGIQHLILLAVEGLVENNLTISDSSGVRLNNFKNLADFDRLEQTQQEIKIRNQVERKYKEAIYNSLSDVYTPNRVRIININIEIDFSKKTRKTTENFPIVVKKDNPATPFDESEVTLSVPRSETTTLQKYQGTGFNPEGPPGVEGQTPPSYKALDGIVGDWDSRKTLVNNEVNQQVTDEERNYDITRVTASVALDGTWQRNYNVDGTIKTENNGAISRTYYEISNKELQKATALVKNAVGYSINRRDSVSVENIKFDRSAEFAREDEAYRREQFIKKVTLFIIIGLFLLLILFLIIRVIVRLIEKYKAIREEQLAERYRKMREQQIATLSQKEVEDEETELSRMVRETSKLIQANPDEIAKLLRIWSTDGGR